MQNRVKEFQILMMIGLISFCSSKLRRERQTCISRTTILLMNRCPQHTFIVLTKRADRMLELSPTLTWSDNIWLGVTVEEAGYADRIGHLKQTPASNKFVCAEPLLGDLGELDLTGIDWVVVGGESGKNFRPCKEEWVLHLRDQCEGQGVTFTFKQWGGRFRKRNGSLLQGRYYHEMPVLNQVRIYNSD